MTLRKLADCTAFRSRLPEGLYLVLEWRGHDLSSAGTAGPLFANLRTPNWGSISMGVESCF